MLLTKQLKNLIQDGNGGTVEEKTRMLNMVGEKKMLEDAADGKCDPEDAQMIALHLREPFRKETDI